MSDKMSQAEIDALLKQMQTGALSVEKINKLSGDEYICLSCHKIIGISVCKEIKQKDIIYFNKCRLSNKHRYINIEFLKSTLKQKNLI